MSGKPILKPLLALAALFLLAACGGGPKVVISDAGKVPGAGPRAEMVRLINLQRSKAGLPLLEAEAKLAKAANTHAGAMARNTCVDFDCGGQKTGMRLSAAGYRAQASRFYVSAGRPAPEDMIREMMSADWGRDMILNPAFRHVAAGYGESDTTYRHYWAIGFAAPAVEDLDALAGEVVRLVNFERGKQGAAPLAISRELNKSARYHANFMAENDCFDHLCPNEPNLGKRARDAGYEWRSVAENIAAGQEDAAEVVAGWMTSPGHRKNILNPAYKEIGIGYVLVDQDGGEVTMRHYWVQNFGAR
jgi:uncharacterized protein YkwD